jgi:hypothetical protein
MSNKTVKEQLKSVIDNLGESKLLEVLKGLTSKINIPFDYRNIKSFEDACEKLGINPEEVYNEDVDTKDEIAYKRLKIIYKAINNGWVPDYNNKNQYKYYPYFQVLSSGLGYSNADYNIDYTGTYVGVRLCTENSEKAVYIGKTFKSEYEDYLL